MPRNVEYSEDYLSRPPNWLMRRGTEIIFLFLFLLVVFSSFMKYSDVIRAEILVTSRNPPINLFSKKEGRVVFMNFESGMLVQENEVLAVIDNPSDYKDIFFLNRLLGDSITSVTTFGDLFTIYPDSLELEISIHTSYQKFLDAFGKYLLYQNLNQEKRESENLYSQLARFKQQIRIKKDQLNAASRNHALAQSGYSRQNNLYEKGVISRQELDESEQVLLLALNKVNAIREELEELYIDSLGVNDLGSKSLNRDFINSNTLYAEMQLARQELKGKIDQWENTNVIKSPVSGTITAFDVWNKYQNVGEGEHLVTVVPQQTSELIGKSKVPIRNSAKIKPGQEVLIKLENYPYREWGLLKGQVINISQIPKRGNQSYYTVSVTIPNLITSYNKEITFKQEMYGTARIVLEETSLLERIFYQFRSIWSDIKY